jgi:hypothetical protein
MSVWTKTFWFAFFLTIICYTVFEGVRRLWYGAAIAERRAVRRGVAPPWQYFIASLFRMTEDDLPDITTTVVMEGVAFIVCAAIVVVYFVGFLKQFILLLAPDLFLPI